MNPIVIDPPDFDQAAAWKECSDYVEQCGGLTHEDGSVNWRTACGADPGVCSCPACGEMYWAWGSRQRCVKCSFEYPTDWWPMYSYGSQDAKRGRQSKHSNQTTHPYYRYGFEHPAADPWKECHTQEWRDAIKAEFGQPK